VVLTQYGTIESAVDKQLAWCRGPYVTSRSALRSWRSPASNEWRACRTRSRNTACFVSSCELAGVTAVYRVSRKMQRVYKMI